MKTNNNNNVVSLRPSDAPVDLMTSSDEVVKHVLDYSYQEARNFIKDEGFNNEFYLSHSGSLKVVDEVIYLTYIRHIGEDTEVITQEVTPEALFYLSVLNQEVDRFTTK